MVNAVISEWGVARAVPIEFKPVDSRDCEMKDKVCGNFVNLTPSLTVQS